MHTHEEPWWLEDGEGSCASCEQRFHVEAMVYCGGCDGPLCSSCATALLETRVTYCCICVDAVVPVGESR